MRARRRSRLTVESLEPRDVPTGVVAVSFVNGALTLTGDDQNNQIVYTIGTDASGAPEVRLTPDPGTTIDDPNDPNPPVPGTTVTLAGTPNSLKVIFKGGDDSFSLDGSRLVLAGGADFDLGDGDNHLDLMSTQAIQLGGLTVTAGDGLDTVILLSPENAGGGITPGPRQDQPVKFAFGHGGYTAMVESFAIPGRGGLQLTALDGSGSFYSYGLTATGPVAGQVGNGSHLWP